MPLPKYEELLTPVLQAVADGDRTPERLRSRLARELGLTEEEVSEPGERSPTPRFTNLVAFALKTLGEYGLTSKTGGGYQLTDLGRRALGHPTRLDFRALGDLVRGDVLDTAPDPLQGFTDAVPYTLDAVSTAPAEGGVHVVLSAEGEVLYVGATGDLRGRLREHLHGDRQASVLHQQVGALLDGPDQPVTAVRIRDWLERCVVRWRTTDDPQGLKAELVRALTPRFNRATELPPTGVWWVNQGVSYDEERRAGIVFAGSGGAQVAHHVNVGRMQPGEVVLHYRRGELLAIGEVVADPEASRLRPYGVPDQRDVGWLTRVEYFPLDRPLSLRELPDRDGDEGPFTRDGAVKQGYLFPLDPDYAVSVRAMFAERWPPGSPWSEGERRFWLFQANPEQWSLAQHLPDLPPGTIDDWIVTRHGKDMRPGDGVALWQTGAGGGVYALAHLVGVPEAKPTADYRPDSVGPTEDRVDLQIDRHVVPPITRAQAREHAVLQDLAVIDRSFAGTNLPVTREQWRALLAAVPLELGAAGPALSTDADGDALAELVAEFRDEAHYPGETRSAREGEREELAAALTVEGLADPDIRLLRRFGGSAYGSPGPQPGLNRLLQDEAGLARVLDTLGHLVHGPGAVEDRLEECLSGGHRLPGVGEALLVRALAVTDPARWVPCYVTQGKVGKLAILDALGEPRPDAGTPATLAAATNDALRRRLEPHFPGDPWGMQEFTWWLLHRERVPPAPLARLADELFLTEDFLARALRLLDDKGQVVFYGPPGTGKTYVARKLAGHIARGGGTVEKVQFHPSYAYEDFVEGYRPRLVNGQVTYEVVDGPLKRIAATAQERPDLTHVLLIDELNRANVSKVLGELLFLLEYREEELRLQYSEAPFALPRNLRIIATMNTADRSIALVDTALRRRFHFVPFFPHLPPIEGLLRRWLAARQPGMVWVADVVDRANAALADRNLAIGPSHFLKPDLTEELVRLAWESSVLPFLEEYFFNDPDQVRRFDLDRLRAAQPDQGLGAVATGDDGDRGSP